MSDINFNNYPSSINKYFKIAQIGKGAYGNVN